MNTLDYEDMDFVYITNHYDVHLEGLCRYNGELHKFKISPALSDKEFYEDEIVRYDVSSLTILEKIKAIYKKKMFEWCVGYHWSYPRKPGTTFKIKRPKWFWNRVFNVYFYGLKRIIK